MKPITNILLIGALICYVFLPFYSMELTGSVTGLSYTGGLIAENFSLGKTLFALLPFIACFGAITFNCMKHRYWGLAAGVFIIAGIIFFLLTNTFHNIPLMHEPEIVPDDPQEGFKIQGLGVGYHMSRALMWLSLLSCIISLMPFKFNMVLEHKIDDQFDRVGHEIHDDWKKFENKTHISGSKNKAKTEKQETPIETPREEPKKENPADYMPPGSRPNDIPAIDNNDHSPYMPKRGRRNHFVRFRI